MPVSAITRGQISQADNTAQLPTALMAAGVGRKLTVDFTVDTSTTSILIGPGDETYASAVVSQSQPAEAKPFANFGPV
jgi:hypothetical protein